VGDDRKMTFRVSDGEDLIDIVVRMNIKNQPDNPVLSINPDAPTVIQGVTWTLSSSVTDIDKGDVHVFSINSEEEIGGDVPSISDQLGGVEFGTEMAFNFDPDTGYLTLSPLNDDIWDINGELAEEVKITIVIKVLDLAGRFDMKMTNLTLIKDGPWIPEVPDFEIEVNDEDPDTLGVQGLIVEVSADDYDLEAYGEGWEYSWSLSDGSKLNGKQFTHEFTSAGKKTIRLNLVKGDYSTSVRSKEVTLEAVPEKPPNEDDPEDSSWGLYIGLAAVILIVLGIVVLLIFMRSRSASVPPEEYPDQDSSRIYGHSRTATPIDRRPDVPDRARGISCPSCGAQVKEDWFLCPECKNPLQ
jgi:hypothetical protein